MSQAPSMPMYWDAYLADTTHLTTEEHGAYLLLLAAMWRRNGAVPDRDRDNARILGLTPAKWRKIKARLLDTIPGFRAENGFITQQKLQKTWENTQEKINKNRSNGAKGGRPKLSKNNNMEKANGFNSDNPNETIPEPEPEPDIREDTNVSLSASPGPIHANDLSEAVAIYNTAADHAGWPKVQKMTPRRNRSLRARIKDCGGIDGWRDVLRRAYASDFVREGWAGFSFDSLISQQKFTGLMEGKYDNRTHSKNGSSNRPQNRPDPALEQIARLAGLGQASGDGGP